MATIKLYLEHPYMAEFDAKVLLVSNNNIILDRTCFFGRGGGQVGDTGEINRIKVVDTLKDESGNVIHVLERVPDFKTGSAVHGKIDWERRHRIMRLHSAAHIVYYFMQQVFGETCKPLSSGIVDDKKDRSDYSFDAVLDKEKLMEVERKANEFIAQAKEIKTWGEKDNPERRQWSVEGFPTMPCGGTHPRNTKEIGKISVSRGKKPGSGKERIEISLVG